MHLAAFIARTAEIDAMLKRLQGLSNDHFNYSPDEIRWGHIGTLDHYTELLKRIAALMAAELGLEPHAMQKALETHVRAHLSELADLKLDLR